MNSIRINASINGAYAVNAYSLADALSRGAAAGYIGALRLKKFDAAVLIASRELEALGCATPDEITELPPDALSRELLTGEPYALFSEESLFARTALPGFSKLAALGVEPEPARWCQLW